MKYYMKLKDSRSESEVSKEVYYSRKRSKKYYERTNTQNGLIASRTLIEK